MRLQDVLEAKNPHVQFKRIEDSEGDDNRGWQVDKLEAILDGENVGYLKMAYIPKERLKEWYPTMLSYISQMKGSHVLPYGYEKKQIKDIPADLLRQCLFMARQAVGRRYPNFDQQRADRQLPDEQVYAEFAKLEQQAQKEFKQKWQDFVNWHVDKPVVDFIRVESDLHRKGIGTALYRAGHQWMKEKGMKLYASTLQQKEAAAAWERMEKDYPIGREKIKQGKEELTRRYFADEEESK